MKRIVALVAAAALFPMSARAVPQCIPEECAAQGGTCRNDFCWVKLPSDENCIELMDDIPVPLRRLSFMNCPNSESNGGGVSIDVLPAHAFGWFIGNVNTNTTSQPAFGSFQRFRSFGSTNAGPIAPISVGTMTTTSLGKELTCDFTAVGSPTHRVEVYNGGTLVLSANARTGTAVRVAAAWPKRLEFGKRNSTPTQTWLYEPATTIQVPGIGSATGDRVVLIAEGSGTIEWYRRVETPSQGLHDIELGPDEPVNVPNSSPLTMGGVAFALLGLGAIAIAGVRTTRTSGAIG